VGRGIAFVLGFILVVGRSRGKGGALWDGNELASDVTVAAVRFRPRRRACDFGVGVAGVDVAGAGGG
jgi:hypothetical protein